MHVGGLIVTRALIVGIVQIRCISAGLSERRTLRLEQGLTTVVVLREEHIAISRHQVVPTAGDDLVAAERRLAVFPVIQIHLGEDSQGRVVVDTPVVAGRIGLGQQFQTLGQFLLHEIVNLADRSLLHVVQLLRAHRTGDEGYTTIGFGEHVIAPSTPNAGFGCILMG